MQEYHLCKKFNWTIDQLYNQPADKIESFLTIMDIEEQYRQREEKKQERRNKVKRHGRK